MRSFAVLTTTLLIGFAIIPGLASTADAQTIPPPTLSFTLLGNTTNGQPVFSTDQILIPEVPITLVITFVNVDPTMTHSFTINDQNLTLKVNTGILAPGENATVSFTILTMTRISYNGTNFTPEAAGTGIRFYCIPHRSLRMVGQITLATVAAPSPEKGILIRAYWIGIIGIAATLVWVGISYFVIKSSSRHFTDQREHVRKGLP